MSIETADKGALPAHQEDPRPTFAPEIFRSAFVPEELFGGPAEHWATVLRNMSPTLPVHMHLEPRVIGSEGGPPLWNRVVEVMNKHDSLKDLCGPGVNAKGEAKRARIKLRLSPKGKFIHRNRYRRQNVICCMQGEAWWLFVRSTCGAADTFLDAATNDNWNGYRSRKYPTTLSVDEMHYIAKNVPAGVEAFVTKFSAGDMMTFDGRWWHATSYETPVLSLFFTPGKDMEVAVREHKRRMGMPMQEGLCVAKINTAKCSRLSADWQKSREGQEMNWETTVPPEEVSASYEKEEENRQ